MVTPINIAPRHCRGAMFIPLCSDPGTDGDHAGVIFEDLVKIMQAVKIQKIADLPGADITAFTIPQKSKNGIAVSKFSMVRNRLPGKATHGQKKRPASNHDDGKNSPLFCQVYRRQDAKRADREKGFDEITAFCLPEHKANKFRFIELLAR